MLLACSRVYNTTYSCTTRNRTGEERIRRCARAIRESFFLAIVFPRPPHCRRRARRNTQKTITVNKKTHNARKYKYMYKQINRYTCIIIIIIMRRRHLINIPGYIPNRLPGQQLKHNNRCRAFMCLYDSYTLHIVLYEYTQIRASVNNTCLRVRFAIIRKYYATR